MTTSATEHEQRLRGAGLRATRPRLQVLGWLEANHGHHPAEAIVGEAGLPKATAYHVLGQLVEAGLVLIAESGAGRVLYESATEPHHHFVCLVCGRILDVPCAGGGAPCVEVAVEGAIVERTDVILKGRCGDCA